uniref:Dehydrogenase n=1 Tax=Macrostomum lignano TaxID=282301 RepID=A0A1I8GZI4_9PLAT
ADLLEPHWQFKKSIKKQIFKLSKLPEMSLLCSLCSIPLSWAIAVASLAYLAYKLFDRKRRAELADIPSDWRSVLVTGCDTGFGHQLALRLAGKGWCVLAGCLTQAAVDKFSAMGNQNLVPIRMDVTDEESVKSAVAKAEVALKDRKLCGLWGVVNNAGISGSRMGPTEFLSADDFHQVFAVNVFGIANVTRSFLPLMRRLPAGRLVNTSSIFGRFASPGAAPYCASKFAVQALSDCYRRELRQFGIRVSCIEPGFHRTPITDKTALTRAVNLGYQDAPAELRDAYGESFRRESVDRLDDLLRLDKVVDAYEEALTSKHPRCRHMIGWDAKLLYWPLAVLPECIGDTLLALRLPRAAKARKNA